MPFPKLNVRFRQSFGTCPREHVTEDENGNAIVTTVPCNKKLPDAENFEIQNQIKAGVNLQEVSTKIIGDKINTKEIEQTIKELKKKEQTKKEN